LVVKSGLSNIHLHRPEPILKQIWRYLSSDTGRVRTFHVPVADKASVHKIVTDNIARETRLHTDESKLYNDAAAHFAAHETVKHSAGEYVRDDVHTNSAEGYFSIFKRGMSGIYQHCAEKHLHRYLAEYDFRYNHRVRLGFNDGERAALAVKNATGKRLTGIIVWLEVRNRRFPETSQIAPIRRHFAWVRRLCRDGNAPPMYTSTNTPPPIPLLQVLLPLASAPRLQDTRSGCGLSRVSAPIEAHVLLGKSSLSILSAFAITCAGTRIVWWHRAGQKNLSSSR
jgi:hypothetical protein